MLTIASPHDAASAADMLARRVRIVLVATSHPGNIGAAARALLTMGLVPVVGPIVSVACGVYWALKMGMRWIRKAASGEEGGSG